MSKKKAPKISGTLEWSVKSLNIHLGCEHRCRYCYARDAAVRRHKFCTLEEWGTTYNRLKEHPFTGFSKKYDGVVMFPTTHDLTPDIAADAIVGISKLIEVGNTVLLVSKPHLEVVKAICKAFGPVKDRVRWRFTIGSFNDEILSYWEPGAPDFDERKASLVWAFKAGFSTSISVEPMLDSDNVVKLFHKLEPYVTDTFWIGKMNQVAKRVQPGTSKKEIARIEAGQTHERIEAIYQTLKDEPKIRWKESIKSELGLELATEPGQDI